MLGSARDWDPWRALHSHDPTLHNRVSVKLRDKVDWGNLIPTTLPVADTLSDSAQGVVRCLRSRALDHEPLRRDPVRSSPRQSGADFHSVSFPLPPQGRQTVELLGRRPGYLPWAS